MTRRREGRTLKGQYHIILEVLFFAIGVAIASFVLVSFSDVQETTSRISIHDQLNTVLHTIANGVVKASATNRTLIRVAIPSTVSGHTYKLYIENNDNITAVDLEDATINATRTLSHLGATKPIIIPGNLLSSSAGSVEIFHDGTRIIIQRG